MIHNTKCLYKQFGTGVHLIKNRDGKKELMIISQSCASVLFIDYDVSFLNSKNGKIIFRTGNEYEYVRKLEMEEIDAWRENL